MLKLTGFVDYPFISCNFSYNPIVNFSPADFIDPVIKISEG